MLTFGSTEGLTDIITVLCQVLLSSFSALSIDDRCGFVRLLYSYDTTLCLDGLTV